MPFLQNEKARAQADVQKADAELANATLQANTQQQTVAQAQVDASSAHATLSNLQAQLPAVQANAASADQAVAAVDDQITQHEANEPDQFIERPNKPPLPNPAWRVWKKRLDDLNAQRQPLAESAAAAHTQLNNLNSSIAAAQAAVQATENRVAQALTTLAQLNQAVAIATEKSGLAHQNLNELNGFTAEIERETMDRSALEKSAAGLWTRVLELEDAHRAAEAASEAAEAALASLIARRDELTTGLATIADQLSAAGAEVTAAEGALADISGQLNDQISGGP
jgi:predicted  nucleic acid-binding Zn-ribbon protein